MRRLAKLLVIAAIFTMWTPGPSSAQKLKVYISVDMEGIAGVVTDQQLGPTGFEYAKFREFMTSEALAAIEGAKAAGATEIVVSDSHGNMQNLLIDKFPADVQLVRGTNRPLSMMQGIDSTFDAVMFVGYHSSTANVQGVRAHTMSSARYHAVELNGSNAPESRINAAIAGYFGVPVVLVTGDDVATAELKAILGNVETAVVKRAIGFHSAQTMTPEAAQALIRAKAQAALQGRSAFKPYRLTGPVRLDLTFKSYRPAEVLAYLPIVERTNSHAIRYNGRTILDVMRFLAFVGNYSVELEP